MQRFTTEIPTSEDEILRKRYLALMCVRSKHPVRRDYQSDEKYSEAVQDWFESTETARAFLKNLDIPQKATPREGTAILGLEKINVANKYSHGVGFASKECFFHTCTLGDLQIIKCYGSPTPSNLLHESDFISTVDVAIMCCRCPYFDNAEGVKVAEWLKRSFANHERLLDAPYFEMPLSMKIARAFKRLIVNTDVIHDKAMSFVYFIFDGENYKIGHAKAPTKRLKELQTGASHVLEIAFLIRCATNNDAIQLESELHHMLKAWRCRKNGEWFHIEDLIDRQMFEKMFPAVIPAYGESVDDAVDYAP